MSRLLHRDIKFLVIHPITISRSPFVFNKYHNTDFPAAHFLHLSKQHKVDVQQLIYILNKMVFLYHQYPLFQLDR
jgi:hypothetical protein